MPKEERDPPIRSVGSFYSRMTLVRDNASEAINQLPNLISNETYNNTIKRITAGLLTIVISISDQSIKPPKPEAHGYGLLLKPIDKASC